jgi:ABC-type phosphate transport system ATPase subunit
MTYLSISNVTKNLENNPILKKINLDVKKGEIISLVGPSGSGKSTLLRCINRLIEIDNGKITYNNQNIKEINPIKLRRNIVLVHQESIMLPGTVYDNITYGPSLKGINDKKNIMKCINESGLALNFIDKNAQKLSGGEKKRVALARALALKPEILLLDEPTSGVDPKNVKTVEKNIMNFSKNRNLTVLWVTHYIEQAKRVSDRIANLKDGTIKNVDNANDFKWEVAY